MHLYSCILQPSRWFGIYFFDNYGRLFVLTFVKHEILDFISLDGLKSHFSLFSFIKNFADSA